MWRGLERMGFKGRRTLAPSTGNGIFFETMPTEFAARNESLSNYISWRSSTEQYFRPKRRHASHEQRCDIPKALCPDAQGNDEQTEQRIKNLKADSASKVDTKVGKIGGSI